MKVMGGHNTRVVQIAVALGLVMLSLSACASIQPSPPTMQDVSGTWRNGDTVLVLNADGTYTLADAPAYTAVGEGNRWANGADPTRDETGSWSVEPDAVRLAGDKLYFEYSGSELLIEWGLDLGSDDPRCYQLVRQASSLVPLGPEDCHIRA